MCVVEAALTGVVVVEALVPAESQAVINKDSVGSSTEVGQVSVVSIIANQAPFKAGGLQCCLHEWKKITSDSFILDGVSHCHRI